MTITEAIKQSMSGRIRRLSWPADLRVEPSDTPECCWIHGKENAAPRWEPQKDDLIADDWVPVTE